MKRPARLNASRVNVYMIGVSFGYLLFIRDIRFQIPMIVHYMNYDFDQLIVILIHITLRTQAERREARRL